MPKYFVPMSISISGSIEVEASSKEEALTKAREKFRSDWKENDPHYGLIVPSVDYDYCEDVAEVEEDEDDA